MTPMNLLAIALFVGVGFALGLAHFHGLRRDARRYLARGMTLGAVAVHAARLLASAAALVFIARSGARPLPNLRLLSGLCTGIDPRAAIRPIS